MAVAIAAALAGCVQSAPVTVSEAYRERHSVRTVREPPSSAACHVSVDKVTDIRSDPLLLGVVLGRAVKAPADPVSWVRSILGGLTTRGVVPVFVESQPADAPVVLHADVELRTAWVTDLAGNKNANVVLHVVVRHGDDTVLDRSIRGSRSTIDWSASDEEIQKLVDEAFGNALDQMASAVQPLCSPPAHRVSSAANSSRQESSSTAAPPA